MQKTKPLATFRDSCSAPLLETARPEQHCQQQQPSAQPAAHHQPLGGPPASRETRVVVGVLACMAPRMKRRLLEGGTAAKPPHADLVAGPDAYRDLPRLLHALLVGRGCGREEGQMRGNQVEGGRNVVRNKLSCFVGACELLVWVCLAFGAVEVASFCVLFFCFTCFTTEVASDFRVRSRYVRCEEV